MYLGEQSVVTYSMKRKVTITGTTACKLEFVVASCTSEVGTMNFDVKVTRVVCAAGFRHMASFLNWYKCSTPLCGMFKSLKVALHFLC